MRPTRFGGTGIDSQELIHTPTYPHRLEAGTLNILGDYRFKMRPGISCRQRNGSDFAERASARPETLGRAGGARDESSSMAPPSGTGGSGSSWPTSRACCRQMRAPFWTETSASPRGSGCTALPSSIAPWGPAGRGVRASASGLLIRKKKSTRAVEAMARIGRSR